MISIAWRRRLVRLWKHFFTSAFTPLVAILAGGLFGLWIYVSADILHLVQYDTGTASQIGDLFGVVNSLFSAMAFLGIIITIILQSQELKLQREELKLTRQEIAKTVEAQQSTAESQERSAEALKNQADSLFYASYLNALTSLRDAQRSPIHPARRFIVSTEAEVTSWLEQIVHYLGTRVGTLSPQGDVRERASELALVFEVQKHYSAILSFQSIVGDRHQVATACQVLTNFTDYVESAEAFYKRGDSQYEFLDIERLVGLRIRLMGAVANAAHAGNEFSRFKEAIDNAIKSLSDWLAHRHVE